jgi:dCMP deaminase
MDTERQSWHETIFRMMDAVSGRSPDPDTKIGAVIVDSRYRPVSWGYNGLPRGVEHTQHRLTRPNVGGNKYQWMCHADVNAIINAKRSVEGCAMYLPIHPCASCAGYICNSGITCVIVDYQRWKEYTDKAGTGYAQDFKLVKEMFEKAGVSMLFYHRVSEEYIMVERH